MKPALFFLILSLTALPAFGLTPERERALTKDDREARDTALAWLQLVDAGDLAKAHDAFPPRVQKNWPTGSFIGWMQKQRQTFGATRVREVMQVDHSFGMAGAPHGEYETVSCQTTFERRSRIWEAVMLSKETGHWQVSGYHLTPLSP